MYQFNLKVAKLKKSWVGKSSPASLRVRRIPQLSTRRWPFTWYTMLSKAMDGVQVPSHEVNLLWGVWISSLKAPHLIYEGTPFMKTLHLWRHPIYEDTPSMKAPHFMKTLHLCRHPICNMPMCLQWVVLACRESRLDQTCPCAQVQVPFSIDLYKFSLQ